jgi:ABC-2 type transport system ATP-binding protein
VRALDSAAIKVENLQLHQPSLDDVFLAKTGRSLEGSDDDGDDDEGEPARGELAAEPA